MAAREISIDTPLGGDELLLVSMQGTEELGRLFQYDLVLYGRSENIKLDDILGQSVTVNLRLSDGGTRHFNGFVSRFSQVGRTEGGYAEYHATLRPWLWFLTRRADCRIFQEKTVPDIIKEVIGDAGFSGDIEDHLSGSYSTREYCVQYRETDFNFISRMMEQEGIYYYFKHKAGKHALVLSDALSSHENIAGESKLPYYPPGSKSPEQEEHVSDWFLTREVQPKTFSHDDYNFKKPKTELLTSRFIQRDHAQADSEIYDYPGEYVESGDGEQYALERIEELHVMFEQVRGETDARSMSTGGLFELTGYPREDQNREYLVIGASYMLTEDEYASGGMATEQAYSCNFTAIDRKTAYRSARITPKPLVQGAQTAVVVGPKDEEIYPDEHGRVKVQFHWDRKGKTDENSSCWMRVAQVWAGKGWGAQSLPRIGQEVLVTFLEGDPDRPLVSGSVYNADNMPPYKLPENKTQSGMKSRSTKKGDEKAFNELRFEDKKDEEEIYFHAEKDFNRVVENNDTLKVGFDKKDKGDQTIEIHNNQKLTVGNSNSDDGSQTIEVWKDRSATIKTGDEILEVEKGKRSATIKTGDEILEVEKGKRTITVKDNDSLTIKTGDHSIKVSAGKSTIEAMKSIELKVGGSSIKIEPAKITIKSVQIAIKGDAKAELKAAMTDVKGDAMVNVKGGLVKIN